MLEDKQGGSESSLFPFLFDSLLFRHCIIYLLFSWTPPSTPPAVPERRGTRRACSGRGISSLAARPSPIPCLDGGTAGSLNRCSLLFDFSAFELILSAQLLKQLSPPAASHFGLDLTHSASLWHTRTRTVCSSAHCHRHKAMYAFTKAHAHKRVTKEASGRIGVVLLQYCSWN